MTTPTASRPITPTASAVVPSLVTQMSPEMTAALETSLGVVSLVRPAPSVTAALAGISDADLVSELSRRAYVELGPEEAARLIAAARDQYGTDELEIDDETRFSVGEDGTWVGSWVLIPPPAPAEGEGHGEHIVPSDWPADGSTPSCLRHANCWAADVECLNLSGEGATHCTLDGCDECRVDRVLGLT